MDNSAERLLNVLERAKVYKYPNQPAIVAWKHVFDIDNDLLVPEKLGGMYVLAIKTSREMLDDNPEAMAISTHIRSCILRICSANLNAGWTETVAFIDQHTIDYLRMHSRLSRLSYPINSLEKEQFDEARKSLEFAINEIRQSNLPTQIKFALINRIRSIVTAIESYQITGQEAVFDAFKLAIFDLKDELSKDDLPGKSKLREGLSLIADLLQVATTAYALTSPVKNMIESLFRLEQ